MSQDWIPYCKVSYACCLNIAFNVLIRAKTNMEELDKGSLGLLRLQKLILARYVFSQSQPVSFNFNLNFSGYPNSKGNHMKYLLLFVLLFDSLNLIIYLFITFQQPPHPELLTHLILRAYFITTIIN